MPTRPIRSTMMPVHLSLNHLLERAGQLFAGNEIVSRLPDRSLRRHSYGSFYARTRQLAQALLDLGLQPGDRVATLSWNHHAHLECYFGIPAAGGVMHTLNLRLAPDEIAWIANDAKDRFLVVDDVLLPLLAQFQGQCHFEKIIVFPFSGAPVQAPFLDYEALLGRADGKQFQYVAHHEDDAVSMCYTSGTTGKPKGVVYSHRSTVLHTLVGCLGDCWGLRSADVVMPVTPMFHANSWGMPYGAVMMGCKLVFPGPHLHPDDLLDLMQLEPPTLSLGVPTIWMSLIQTYEASLEKQAGRWKLPAGMRSLVGGAAVPEALIRACTAARREASMPERALTTTSSGAATTASSWSSAQSIASQMISAGLSKTPPPIIVVTTRRWPSAAAARKVPRYAPRWSCRSTGAWCAPSVPRL